MKVGGIFMKSFAGFLRFVAIRWLLKCAIFGTITIQPFVALDRRGMTTTAWEGCQKATIGIVDGLLYLRYIDSGDMGRIGARTIANLTHFGASRRIF